MIRGAMYSTSTPVTADGFFDRESELDRLRGLVRQLLAGAPSWLAIVGPRKVGKTSLLLELARRTEFPDVVFTVVDCFEELPHLPDILRRYALRTIDGALGTDLGASLEALSRNPAEFRMALQHSARFDVLAPTLRSLILELVDPAVALERPALERIRPLLDLPEQLAEALDLHFLVVWDEFQELAALASRGKGFDILPLMRSRWQRHRRTSYVISGSARTMLTELVTDERSPFFQHFSVMELGPFERDQAIGLLQENAPRGWPVSEEVAERMFEILGGHPFYLQMLGETLTRQPSGDDEAALKQALQELLFSRTGRLALYFENELQRLVGRSAYLVKTLEALAGGATRLTEVAKAIQTSSGSTARYLERLKDAVVHTEEGEYLLADPVFGLWLKWRRPGGTVVPMGVIGDEAELAVAEHLARMGFDLVYQSRASRGAFDLLATRGPHQLGIQVKRSALPLRFGAAEWKRMEAESERFGWRWIVAVLTPPPGNQVMLLDPDLAKVKKNVTLDAGSAIQNLLSWVDRAP